MHVLISVFIEKDYYYTQITTIIQIVSFVISSLKQHYNTQTSFFKKNFEIITVK